jgi:hypothetical protein
MSAKCAAALKLIAEAAAKLPEHAEAVPAERSGPELADAEQHVIAAAKAVAAAGACFGDGGVYGVAPVCVKTLVDDVHAILKATS